MKAKVVYRLEAQIDKDTGEEMIPMKELSIMVELDVLPYVGDIIELWTPDPYAPWYVRKGRVTRTHHRLHPMEQQVVTIHVDVFP